MKKFKGMKLTVMILAIVLLAMVSFVGIYVKDKNAMKNLLPEYLLGRDLKGHRRVELKVDDSAETIKYDAEGNQIGAEDTQKEVARTEEKRTNPEENLTEENFKQAKKIVEKRLSSMQVNDYLIRQDSANGNMVLELPETTNTDRIVGQLYLQGKLEIVDKDTSEVLMTNEDVKSVKSGYGTAANGTTVVFVNIQFNKAGTEKFKNITNTYVETKVEKEEAEEGQEQTEETIKKEIALNIDGSTLLTTHFEEEVSNGLLQLSLGSSSSDTTAKEMQEYLLQANSMEALLDNGELPIVYQVEQNKYVFSAVTENIIKAVIVISIIVLAIAMIYAILTYQAKGIIGSISFIGYIAVLLIALRYFNVEITIGGMVAILFSMAVSYAILIGILKEKEVMTVMKKYSIMLIPTLIIAIVFTFMNMAIGITLFWGIVISLLYHISITNIMLKD